MGWFSKRDDENAQSRKATSSKSGKAAGSKSHNATSAARAVEAVAPQHTGTGALKAAASTYSLTDSQKNALTSTVSSGGASNKPRDLEEGVKKKMSLVDSSPRVPEEKEYEAAPETVTHSFSQFDDDDQNSYEEATRQNHLNSLFNGHLMKWKFEAEEGSAFVRVPAFFGALGLVVTVIVALILEKEAFALHSIVMAVCVLIMSIFILILDGRFLVTSPLSTRAHLRNILTRNFNMFRFVWGRGLLYIMAGIINISQMWLITMISGAFMVVVGFVAIIVGIHASRKFAALRNSLADESFLLLVFGNYDNDGDGYLEPNEFALLLADLGMELDDRYTLKAFNVIDSDSDRRIAFDEFNHWWASGYIERGRKRYIDEEDEDTYHRMS